MDPGQIAILSGLIIGLLYGSIGLLSGFCMASGLRGWWAEGDSRLARTFALAMGVAIAASQLLAARGAVDLGKSIYLQPSFSAPVIFLGGMLFGYGMVLSNGCGSRALVLLGRGNLRSFVVVVVLGIFAEMTLKGLIAPARIAAVRLTQVTVKIASLPALLSSFGLNEVYARMFATSLVSAALIIFALAHAPFRRSFGQIAGGVAMGLLIAAGWYSTGHLGADDFNPAAVTSLTFVAPIADSLQYVMLSTGSTLNFGIATIGGVVAGSLVTALLTGRFELEGYRSPTHMLRSAGGAALMGAGGVMALGCSIGQGLTGISTLAVASFIAVAGLLSGAAIALRGVLRVRPLAADAAR
jgi:uncharacterized protein